MPFAVAELVRPGAFGDFHATADDINKDSYEICFI
jgi:hypothetical protein